MNSSRAVLCGYYGMGNVGDEALLMSLLQMLPQGVEPIVLSGNPQETKNNYGVISCYRKSAWAILKALEQSNIFIWGGGSLMQDSTSLANPVYYAGLMALAQSKGLKTIAWAQGIGPLNRSASRWLTKKVLWGCNGISVRDQASAKLLKNWGLEPMVAPDPVWALSTRKVPSSTKKSINTNLPLVAVVLRSHSLLTFPRLQILITALQNFQRQSDCYLLLIPFQPQQDLKITEQIASALKQNFRIVSLGAPQQLLGLFKTVKMTIGMRLHSIIMAASAGCKCFALSYDPKVTQLMSELNLPGYELSNLPQNPLTISNNWLEIYHQEKQLDTKHIASLVQQAKNHQQLLREVIVND